MFRIAVVEDEESCAEKLIGFSARYSAEHEETVEAVYFKNPVLFLEQYRGEYDAVFMDIAMPMMDGMECANRLREKDEEVPLIFTTYMSQYAIRGYEVDAMEFVIKQVLYEDFWRKLGEVIRYWKKQ